MTNINVNSISSIQNNTTVQRYLEQASQNVPFNEVLSKVSNVPTGRVVQQKTQYNINPNCAVHGNILQYVNHQYTPNTKDAQTKKAIEIAKSYLGGKYVWGATGPDAFDCSGFTQYIYKHAYGKEIPRVSYEQAKFGEKVNRDELQPGDLVFFDTMNKGHVSHVGFYIGNNKFIHAASSKSGIIESELSGYYKRKYLGARRP